MKLTKDRIVKLVGWILIFCPVSLLISCQGSSNPNDLTGRKYEGYYHPIERIRIYFDTDSTFHSVISSTDFVGHFFDDVSGIYSVDYPAVHIIWKDADKRNSKYKDLPPAIDSAVITASKNTLLLYENGEEYELTSYHRLELFKTGHGREPFAAIGFVLILLVSVFIRFILPAIVILVICFLFFKWIQRRKNKSR